ncbi:MAG: class I SAM-dependent methyltransferase [Oscillospiraceae bacterium]|nr:class I SAM-dependent methyltransferase [Oscillospiraceae bacterium]
MNILLSPRLKKIAELIRPQAAVVDVGCDHGYLAAYLLQENITGNVTATDINAGPLESARRTLKRVYAMPHKNKHSTNESVKLMLTDGLDGINETDDVVIAGMGGELISGILEKAAEKSEVLSKPGIRLILQPMTRTAELRRYLLTKKFASGSYGNFSGGFEIVDEFAVTEGRKSYIIILAQTTVGKPESLISERQLQMLCHGGLIAYKTDSAAQQYAQSYYEKLSIIAQSKNEKSEYYRDILRGLKELPAYKKLRS